MTDRQWSLFVRLSGFHLTPESCFDFQLLRVTAMKWRITVWVDQGFFYGEEDQIYTQICLPFYLSDSFMSKVSIENAYFVYCDVYCVFTCACFTPSTTAVAFHSKWKPCWVVRWLTPGFINQKTTYGLRRGRDVFSFSWSIQIWFKINML